jgi:hypothetical protein
MLLAMETATFRALRGAWKREIREADPYLWEVWGVTRALSTGKAPESDSHACRQAPPRQRRVSPILPCARMMMPVTPCLPLPRMDHPGRE